MAVVIKPDRGWCLFCSNLPVHAWGLCEVCPPFIAFLVAIFLIVLVAVVAAP